MRTLEGVEAIQVAADYDIYLYDLETKADVTAEQARALLKQRPNAQSFVIDNWPDTDEEAEQIVLKEYSRALKEGRWYEARIFDISNDIGGGLPLNLDAAELAAERLVEQNKLELVESHHGYNVYRLPRTVYFADEFLDGLRRTLCDDCAELNLEGPFHESCLMNLVDYIKTHEFTFDDITEETRATGRQQRSLQTFFPSISKQWLSKTASATKSRWRSVLKPLRAHEEHIPEDKRDDNASELRGTSQLDEGSSDAGATRSTAPDTPRVSGGRKQITKDALMDYLQSVEILEEDGELGRLRDENAHLLNEISLRDQSLNQAEKRRGYMEKQFRELQRDMDIMVQAMHIAKRREEETAVHVVDTTISDSE